MKYDIIAITGKSAAGKDRILREIVKMNNENINICPIIQIHFIKSSQDYISNIENENLLQYKLCKRFL